MDILKFIESLPNDIKNLIVASLINSSIAMNNVENDMRTVQPIPMQQRQQQQGYRRQTPASLLQSMQQGQYNEAYVNYFYEVLQKADDLVNNSTPQQMQMLAEKYGMGDHATKRYQFLQKNNDQIYGGRTPQEVKRDEYSRRVSQDDNYPIEKMINNRKHIKNALEHSIGGVAQYDYTIKIQRMYQTRYNIEHITDVLHVKELRSEHNGRILEFYIPKHIGITRMAQTVLQEIMNIGSVSFSDEYGRPFNYRIHGFYKQSQNGQYDILKFKGNRIENVGIIR